VDLVADPDQEPAAGPFADLVEALGEGRVGEIDPADDPGHELVGRRGGEEFAGLGEAGAGLDEHRAVDTRRGQLRLEILGPEAPSDRLQLLRQPGVVGGRRVPEVVVGVDDYGVGTSRARSPSALSSSHSWVGIGASKP
jgi:hypothetical protein